MRIAMIFGLLILLFSPSVGTALEEVELEEVVVTATRTEKLRAEAPASVSVVTKEEVERRNIQALDQAVNLLPGVYNKRDKGLMTTTAHVAIRGIPGGQRTMVILDGLPLNSPYTGGVDWEGLIPEGIERIEVARGPFSSLYGGHAMGGVVNIITRMPERRELTLKGGYGSHDLWSGYASYGDRWKGWRLLASYGYKSTEGYRSYPVVVSSRYVPSGTVGAIPTTDPQGNPRFIIGDKGKNGCWQDAASFKVSYEFTPGTEVRFSFMRVRHHYDYDDPRTYLRDATTGEPVWEGGRLKEYRFLGGEGLDVRDYFTLSLEAGDLWGASVKFTAGALMDEEDWWISPKSGATVAGEGPGEINETDSLGLYADLQISLPLGERHLLTGGVSFRHGEAETEKHRLSDWTDEDSKTELLYKSRGKDIAFALFLQDEISILPTLTAYCGARFDWWRTYDGMSNEIGGTGYREYDSRDSWAISPKLSLVWRPLEKTTVRGSIGRAFRPPSIYELYRTWSSWGRVYEGNPDLDPEMVTSLEVGVEQGLWKGSSFKFSFFYNWMDDLIYITEIEPRRYRKVNAGKAESKGVEVEFEQRVGKYLRLFANYTYTLAKVMDNPAKPEIEGKRLTHIPKNMANLGGELTYGPFGLTVTGRYVSKRYGKDDNSDTVDEVFRSWDPFFVVDAKVSWKPFEWATVSLSVDNLFDEDYYSYYKAPGRTFFGEITLKF